MLALISSRSFLKTRGKEKISRSSRLLKYFAMNPSCEERTDEKGRSRKLSLSLSLSRETALLNCASFGIWAILPAADTIMLKGVQHENRRNSRRSYLYARTLKHWDLITVRCPFRKWNASSAERERSVPSSSFSPFRHATPPRDLRVLSLRNCRISSRVFVTSILLFCFSLLSLSLSRRRFFSNCGIRPSRDW